MTHVQRQAKTFTGKLEFHRQTDFHRQTMIFTGKPFVKGKLVSLLYFQVFPFFFYQFIYIWWKFKCSYGFLLLSLVLMTFIDFRYAQLILVVTSVTFKVLSPFWFLQFSYNDVYWFRWMKTDFSYIYIYTFTSPHPPFHPPNHPPVRPPSHPPPPRLPDTSEVSSGGSHNDGVIGEP